ncbi:MAG TPA: FAD-dependent oxidoreductase [Firmicutes bacterium]|nr:FAD-dependent oxidoreductase [Bacillota bacterium]
MSSKQTATVVVIGGGATGASTALALAELGIRAALVERRDYAAGTSGRNHGLLHSGARYAVKDPQAALECWPENRRLRQLFPECVDPCGGLFVALDEPDEAYLSELERACAVLGIPARRVSGQAAREMEPALSPRVRDALAVPDAAVDPFRLVATIARAAAAAGAVLMPGYEVVEMVPPEGAGGSGRWRLRLAPQGEIEAEAVVDAAGPWAAEVARLAGVRLPLELSAGALIVYHSRPVQRVINRARPPGDGDILVPGGPVLVAGTTARPVPLDRPELLDPPGLRAEPEEIGLLQAEAEAMLPVLASARRLRAFAGIRPLVGSLTAHGGVGEGKGQAGDKAEDRGWGGSEGEGRGEGGGGSGGGGEGQRLPVGPGKRQREQTRDFRVFTPDELSAPPGFYAVVGGKLTTCLLMGEAAARQVAKGLGIAAPPGRWVGQSQGQRPGPKRVCTPKPWWQRAAGEAEDEAGRAIICECEWVSRRDLEAELAASFARDGFAGARRRLRLGMGGCQGTQCSLALPGVAWEVLSGEESGEEAQMRAVARIQQAWREFVGSRWAGVAALGAAAEWNSFRQAEQAYLVYTELLGVAPADYGFPGAGLPLPAPAKREESSSSRKGGGGGGEELEAEAELVVVGSGLAAYAAAWAAAAGGVDTLLIAGGEGDWARFSGVFSGLLATGGARAEPPGFSELSKIAPWVAAPGGTEFKLPTALGTVRRGDLVPGWFTAADLSRPEPLLLVEWSELPFFPGRWAAAALRYAARSGAAGEEKPAVHGVSLRLQDVFGTAWKRVVAVDGAFPGVNWRALGHLLEIPGGAEKLASFLVARIEEGAAGPEVRAARREGRLRVGLPVLGLDRVEEVRGRLEKALGGLPVAEIVGLLPAPGGLRLHGRLARKLAELGVRIETGWEIAGVEEATPATGVVITGRARGSRIPVRIRGERVLLATDLTSPPPGWGGPWPLPAYDTVALAGAAAWAARSERPEPGTWHAALWQSGYGAGWEAVAALRGERAEEHRWEAV